MRVDLSRRDIWLVENNRIAQINLSHGDIWSVENNTVLQINLSHGDIWSAKKKIDFRSIGTFGINHTQSAQ